MSDFSAEGDRARSALPGRGVTTHFLRIHRRQGFFPITERSHVDTAGKDSCC
jgi:hypothetical protein